MANEVELKLRIAAADIARLRRHPAIQAALATPAQTRALTSIYFDTPQLALLDRGISLRVRRMSGQWFQSVKTSGSAIAGLHQRLEWEDIIANGAPDFSKITEPRLTTIFDDDALRAALHPLFRTEVRRTEWQLAYEDGSRIELALDVGQLVAGEQRDPISEIELELKAGDAACLFELALQLQRDLPLWLENKSKAQAGYAYYRPAPPAIVKARPLPVAGDLNADEAFQQIAGECLRQWQGNQEMVLRGADIEGVHQMRVALRRLRSALSAFRDVIPPASCDELREELRWITGVLGQARDLDVFLAESLPPAMQQLPQHAGLARLQQLGVQAQTQAYQAARSALRSQRYQRLLLQLSGWLHTRGWRGPDTPVVAVEALARRMLAKRYKGLRRHGKRLMHMRPEQRHATRIVAKKMRYAAEFFASLFPDARENDFLPALSRLLDILGVLNDIAVTEALIRHLIGSRPGRALDEALNVFIGWNAYRGLHRLEGLEPAWNRFAAAKPFWLD